jgi:hypothetical protein
MRCECARCGHAKDDTYESDLPCAKAQLMEAPEPGKCPYMDPSPIASTPIFMRRGTTARVYPPRVDLDQPRSGHDGLFARQLPSGLMPTDIPGFCWRRFDLFAIDPECSQP